jgi:photosystem II stability/assembly factor-like uncharacterized protein
MLNKRDQKPGPELDGFQKRRRLILRLGLMALVVLLVSSAVWYLALPPKQNKWHARDYPNSRVEFFDNQTGVIVGPRVLHTQNGGGAWSIIDYVNPSDSFKPKDNPRYAKHLVDFVDPEWAWRVSPRDPESVEYSSDGARFWSEPIRTGVKSRTSLVFISREVGWVLGDVPVVTHDGGGTWRAEKALANHRFEYPFFLDRNYGWVANNRGINGKTADGGLHWDIVRTDLKNIRSLFFVNSLNGWAVGADRLVARTDNGGHDWKTIEVSIPSDPLLELLDVFFLTPDLGWIAGNDGFIVMTNDGGKTWSRASTPTTVPICSIRFTDAQHGWAVGGGPPPVLPVFPPSNVILETIDGGKNWKARVF